MQNLNTKEMTQKGAIALNVSEMPQENISVEKGQNYLLVGDNLIWLKKIPDNSIDSIVTDPPAGISFMSRGWDSDKGGRDNWIKWMSDVATECKRVLKPGGHAFVWAIPRTSHWTATSWENAGFEIRDVVAHVFGSGFPKSLNIGKQVDKLQGNEREEYIDEDFLRRNPDTGQSEKGIINKGLQDGEKAAIRTKGTSEWEGWGTALKPAREDWILMRKPIEKGLNVAENCLKWGTGGINIDESRVGTEEITTNGKGKQDGNTPIVPLSPDFEGGTHTGRFPANLIHDNSEEVRECFPETSCSGAAKTGRKNLSGKDYSKPNNIFGGGIGKQTGTLHNDSGNASRFFKSIIYQAKASKSERKLSDGTHSNHPTVKPIALMEYLIKMVTPKGGIVLDPFAGSGSTLVAAKQNGYKYVGIEMESDYIKIIKARLE